MAAFLRHGIIITIKTSRLVSNKNVFLKSYATKAEKKKGIDRKPTPKIDATAKSLASKGFLRPQREYIPPNDVESKLNDVFKSILGDVNINDSTQITDLNQRFELFLRCEQKFNHGIPNSLLHHIKTLRDVKIFYKTPVDVRTPLDKMRNMDLPENLNIQFDYHRFNPKTDKMFNGVTAYPESSTIVTGLKYKNKYIGTDNE